MWIALGGGLAALAAAISLPWIPQGAAWMCRRWNRRRPEGVDGTGAPLDDEELAAFTGILRASGIDDRVYDSRRAA